MNLSLLGIMLYHYLDTFRIINLGFFLENVLIASILFFALITKFLEAEATLVL